MENKYELVLRRIFKKIEEDNSGCMRKFVSWDKDSVQIKDVDFEKFFNDEKYIPCYEYKGTIGVDCKITYNPLNKEPYSIVTE